MTSVQTARGPIDCADLGRVLVHEHVFAFDLEYTLNYRPDFVEEEQIAEAARRLEAVKAAGIDTIMDLTVLGLGRNVPTIVKVAEMTQVNIIVATGCYAIDHLPKSIAQVGPGLTFDRADPLREAVVPARVDLALARHRREAGGHLRGRPHLVALVRDPDMAARVDRVVHGNGYLAARETSESDNQPQRVARLGVDVNRVHVADARAVHVVHT